jgi:integrase
MQSPEPEINNLQLEIGPDLDKVTILSHSDDMSRRSNVVEINEVAAPRVAQNPSSGGPSEKKRKRKPKRAVAYLQEEEIERLFRVIRDTRDRAIFRLAYHAGLRASEVGMLDLRDYQPRTDRIYIHRLKGSNSGEHHLCREEAKALKALLKIRGTTPGAIFQSNRRRGISRKQLDVLMKHYGRLAMLPAKLCHFHVLKHSCATHLLSRGFGVEQVQDWIGHANIQNTMIYAKISNSRRAEMARALKDTWR